MLRVATAALVVVLGAATITGCGRLFSDNSSQQNASVTGVLPDGGICTKDPVVIKNVMLAPPMCSSTAPCPCGTYCSSQTGGNCIADCVDDTWCAPGYTCSPFGQCLKPPVDGGSSDGAALALEPSCPRNTTLLDSIKTAPRACSFDDTCPFGSFCNHVTETCDWSCKVDTDCSSMNTTGHTFACGCLGQCVEIAAPRAMPTTALPTLEVTSQQYLFDRPTTITTPNWGDTASRRISIVGVAQTAPTAAIAVQAIPGPGLMVACPPATTPTAANCTVSIPSASFTLSNGAYRSTPIALTVAPSTGAPTATTWDLRLESAGFGNMPRVVNLRYADAPTPTLNPSTFMPLAGSPDPAFLGAGVVQFRSPTGMPMTIPVKARVTAIGGINYLVLLDDTQQLSPSGKLVLFVPSDLENQQVYLDAMDGTNDPALRDPVTGGLLSRLVNLSISRDAVTGNLAGTFDRSVVLDYPWYVTASGPPQFTYDQVTSFTFTLAKTTTGVPVCTDDSQCSVGAHCDLGLCSSGPNHLFQSAANIKAFTHKRMQSWQLLYPNTYWLPGWYSFYAPSRWVRDQASYYQLHGPLAPVSGEPLATIWDPYWNILAQNQSQVLAPLLTQHDTPYLPSASSLLRSCLYDLARDPQEPSVSPSDEAFDYSANCINLGRVALAMGDPQTFQRTLEAWLTVHSFVLREGLEELGLDAATQDGDPTPGMSPPVPYTELLAAGESGFGLLLDLTTNNNDGIRYWGGFASGDPDFRDVNEQSCSIDQECNGTGPALMTCDTTYYVCKVKTLAQSPQHDQPEGFPPMILEMAGSYLKVLEAYLAKTARETYGQPADSSASSSRNVALSRFGTAMRLVLAVEQMAVTTNFCGVPENCAAIAQRFNAARDEMNIVRQRVVQLSDALRNGFNPFGFPEDDIPLFFGDPTGTNSRYFAASDYLIDGWAGPAVTEASASLDAARSAWLSKSQAAVQDELNQHNRDQEMGQLMSKYGSPILAACGNMNVPDGSGNLTPLDSMQIIPYFADSTKVFDNNMCFIDNGPACTGLNGIDGREALRASLNYALVDSAGNLFQGDLGPTSIATAADLFVQSEACKISYFNYLPKDNFVSLISAVCPHEALQNPRGSACSVVRQTDGNLYFVSKTVAGSTGQDFTMPVAALYGPIRQSDLGTTNGIPNFYSFAQPPAWQFNGTFSFNVSGSLFQALIPAGTPENIYSFRDFRNDPFTLNGNTPYSSPQGFSVSSNWNSLLTSFPVCGNNKNGRLPRDYARPPRAVLPPSCYKGQMGVAYSDLNTNMLRLQRAKEVLDNGQKTMDTQLSTCKQIDSENANLARLQGNYNSLKSDYQLASQISDSISKGLSGGGGGASVVGIFTAGLSSILGGAINDAAAQVAQMEAEYGRAEKAQDCWNNFRQQQRAMSASQTDVSIASGEVNSQAIAFKNLQLGNESNLREGVAVYQREQGSPVPSLSHTFWIDEKVERFKRDLEWARRLAFVAMRAVEYEFQQSLPFRSQIVAATTPNQLDAVILGLKQEQAARTINRRRPDEASIVLSLRDDVLSIPDNSTAPAGERNWTPAQRFSSRLWDATYALRDSKGNYLGQGIPFTLGPQDILETRCGERLWRATATLQGDSLDASAPGASVLLLKRNTFSSQYCSGKAPTLPGATAGTTITPTMQVGVIHPSASLFQPGSAVDLGDANQFTAALLYPWFNVRKTDFYRTTYQDGASEELAGRGLYGDYVMLFPKQMLDDDFTLERVEDVLLRLDYLSVDNLSQ